MKEILNSVVKLESAINSRDRGEGFSTLLYKHNCLNLQKSALKLQVYLWTVGNTFDLYICTVGGRRETLHSQLASCLILIHS